MSETSKIDVVHLCVYPPFVPGSYNRLINSMMESTSEFGQVMMSRWSGSPPDGEEAWPRLITLDPANLPFRSRMTLRLPERMLFRFGRGITSSRAMLTYYWQVVEQISVLKPRIIICYDLPWIGRLLRPHLDWPCRLVLSQHGQSYYRSDSDSVRVYSLQSFDTVWALSRTAYRFDRARISSYEPSVVVIPNFVDDKRFRPVSEPEQQELRRKWNLPVDRPIVLFLSVLRPKKGAHLLLEAWRTVLDKVPNAFLWIVGGEDSYYGGRYMRDLQAMAKSLGVEDSLRFEGSVDPDQTHACYQASDIYTFPTLCSEGWGLSITEALSCGLPCLTSDYEVGREAFTEEEVEFVPDPNLDQAFAEPLIRLLQDPARRRQMGESGRRLVTEKYSIHAIAPRLADFYRQQMRLVKSTVPG